MARYSQWTALPAGGLFGSLPEAEWKGILQVGVPVRFAPRDMIFRQGDRGRHVHVILAGCVKIARCEPDGAQAMLTVRAAGDVVGDFAALDGQPRFATVTALTTVLTQLLTGDQFRDFVSRPTVAPGFATYTVDRLREADIQRTELAVLPVRQRLARALLRLEEENRRIPGRPPVSLPQQELAELVGASRNAVVGELSALRAAGVLRTGRRLVVIVDVDALSRHAYPGVDGGGYSPKAHFWAEPGGHDGRR
ncbi:Crp/Fnr family transcriptional regulator [Catenuloplanes atrovinosus]|uniref:CRP-like cAMP-binding protein n=1 Tax=Catenuloplanes atrovinosus TaxID=137266 RepID=A0AAE4CBL0_9ACTN|nr:Crp/Fnr family transcriptional regulator [Catenuloplanes atrovinosus]MDR7277034.1 CRP-like cAMP-binding protein [Catenuloplanes atrovinosus]